MSGRSGGAEPLPFGGDADSRGARVAASPSRHAGNRHLAALKADAGPPGRGSMCALRNCFASRAPSISPQPPCIFWPDEARLAPRPGPMQRTGPTRAADTTGRSTLQDPAGLVRGHERALRTETETETGTRDEGRGTATRTGFDDGGWQTPMAENPHMRLALPCLGDGGVLICGRVGWQRFSQMIKYESLASWAARQGRSAGVSSSSSSSSSFWLVGTSGSVDSTGTGSTGSTGSAGGSRPVPASFLHKSQKASRGEPPERRQRAGVTGRR